VDNGQKQPPNKICKDTGRKLKRSGSYTTQFSFEKNVSSEAWVMIPPLPVPVDTGRNQNPHQKCKDARRNFKHSGSSATQLIFDDTL